MNLTREFVGARYDGQIDVRGDFSNADMTGATFRDAHLTGCNFAGSRLTGVDFAGASLTRCVFDKSSGIGLRAERSTWKDCKVRDADWTRFSSANAEFLRCRFDGFRAHGWNAEQIKVYTGTFTNAVLTSIWATGAEYVHSTFRGARLHGRLDYARMTGSSLAGAVLQRVSMVAGDVDAVDFGQGDQACIAEMFSGRELRGTPERLPDSWRLTAGHLHGPGFCDLIGCAVHGTKKFPVDR